MGNDISKEGFDGPPEVLKGRDIASVAKYIKSKDCKNVFVMVSFNAWYITRTGPPNTSPYSSVLVSIQFTVTVSQTKDRSI